MTPHTDDMHDNASHIRPTGMSPTGKIARKRQTKRLHRKLLHPVVSSSCSAGLVSGACSAVFPAGGLGGGVIMAMQDLLAETGSEREVDIMRSSLVIS